MKIKQEHLEHLRAAIVPLDTEALRQRYLAGDFPKSARVGDLYLRYRWDLLHMAGLTPYVCKNLYSYLDDSHIDTALRSIVKPL